MRDYEVVYVFRSVMANEDIEARVESYHERILTAAGAEITAVEYWGKRELAYPIDDQRNGTYVVAQFTAPPDVLTDFERALKLDDDLLRHLVVLSEGELPTPPSMQDAFDDDEDEDDDDEEDDEDEDRDDEGEEDEDDEDRDDEGEEDEEDEDEEDDEEEDEKDDEGEEDEDETETDDDDASDDEDED